jgi:hypothetical protein
MEALLDPWPGEPTALPLPLQLANNFLRPFPMLSPLLFLQGIWLLVRHDAADLSFPPPASKAPSAAITGRTPTGPTAKRLLTSNLNGLTVYWTNSIKPIIPLQDVYGNVVSGGIICEARPA